MHHYQTFLNKSKKWQVGDYFRHYRNVHNVLGIWDYEFDREDGGDAWAMRKHKIESEKLKIIEDMVRTE